MPEKIKLCALTTISKTMDWFIVDSMRNLAQNGYEITLVSNMEPGFAERNRDYATCLHLPMSRGAGVADLFTKPFFLWKYFRQHRFDIIYYTSPNVSLYASLAGWLAGVKFRVYSQCGLRYVAFQGIKRVIFKWVEKLTCMFSTHVRGQSPLNRQFAIDEGLCSAEKISVVGIGGTIGVNLCQCDAIDIPTEKKSRRCQYGVAESAFVYGYVGRINADKGINELIKAFLQVHAQHKNTHLVLVGMLDDANPITEGNLKTAQTHPAITLTGNVPPAEVYNHMAMFDVLTHPTYREGFGKVLQEAMGMHLPIITTNVPGPSEVIENGISGILVEIKAPQDLANKMEMLYKDADMRNNLARNARERAVKFFDRPIMLQNILDDLNIIVAN